MKTALGENTFGKQLFYALESSIIGLSLFLVCNLITAQCAKEKAERKEKRETARPLGPYLAAAVMVEYIMNFGG